MEEFHAINESEETLNLSIDEAGPLNSTGLKASMSRKESPIKRSLSDLETKSGLNETNDQLDSEFLISYNESDSKSNQSSP